MWFIAVCFIAGMVFAGVWPGHFLLFCTLEVIIFGLFMWRMIYVVYDRRRAARINYMFNAGLMYDPDEDDDDEGEPDDEPEPLQSSWNGPAHHPEAFEAQMAEMFRRYGYKVVETPYQGDHGIDLKIIKPNEFAIVQCKRWAKHNKVGEPVVRDFFGAMQHEGADLGYIITTSDFSDQAIEWARGKRIVMINGENLQKMLEETGMTEKQGHQEPKVKRVY